MKRNTIETLEEKKMNINEECLEVFVHTNHADENVVLFDTFILVHPFLPYYNFSSGLLPAEDDYFVKPPSLHPFLDDMVGAWFVGIERGTKMATEFIIERYFLLNVSI
jgi:hypothetical protein